MLLKLINARFGNYFFTRYFFNLEMIYYLVAIREDTKTKEVMQYRNLLNLYDAILTEKASVRTVLDSTICQWN